MIRDSAHHWRYPHRDLFQLVSRGMEKPVISPQLRAHLPNIPWRGGDPLQAFRTYVVTTGACNDVSFLQYLSLFSQTGRNGCGDTTTDILVVRRFIKKACDPVVLASGMCVIRRSLQMAPCRAKTTPAWRRTVDGGTDRIELPR